MQLKVARRPNNGDGPEWVKREQVPIAGDDRLRAGGYRQLQNLVVLWIATHSDGFGDVYQPGGLHQTNEKGIAFFRREVLVELLATKNLLKFLKRLARLGRPGSDSSNSRALIMTFVSNTHRCSVVMENRLQCFGSQAASAGVLADLAHQILKRAIGAKCVAEPKAQEHVELAAIIVGRFSVCSRDICCYVDRDLIRHGSSCLHDSRKAETESTFWSVLTSSPGPPSASSRPSSCVLVAYSFVEVLFASVPRCGGLK